MKQTISMTTRTITIMIAKIISGGQTGADQGGLQAGKELGIETGGTAPLGYETEDGFDISLKFNYGLEEGEYDPKIYPKRTRKNVGAACGTVWFGNDNSPGAKLTLNTRDKLEKPTIRNPSPTKLAVWLKLNNIRVLNVAGNRESKNKGIAERTKKILIESLNMDI